MTRTKLLAAASVFLTVFYNPAFFRNVWVVYLPSAKNIPFLISIAVLLPTVIFFLLSIVCSKHTTKPVLILLFLLSAPACYFMDHYNVVIDHLMIQNIRETNAREAAEWLSFKLFVHFLLLGILPSIFVYRAKMEHGNFKREALSRLTAVVSAALVMYVVVLSMNKHYASFFTAQKSLRFYTNPTYYLYSAYKYARLNFLRPGPVEAIGMDAQGSPADAGRDLVILVVGESARADRFSINGYARETNPLLKKEDFINFPGMHACGTSTNIAVPCMFSILGKDHFSRRKAESTQNILDVLNTAGVSVLWRDNNSSSQGVAARVPYEDYLSPKTNPVCDVECRDVGMMAGLEDYIESRPAGDILIVLHQRGSHGPAYYERYPKEFEKFTPACNTPQIEYCTSEEINNAYDNSILYTDYFLSNVIRFLKGYSTRFETAMIYMSDHGESLGEGGVYFHSTPYFLAPEAQRRIPALIWFGDAFKKNLDMEKLKIKAKTVSTPDILFHTLLGLMDVNTSVYVQQLDFVDGTRIKSRGNG
ncbi:phosphoethanolamine--lipid A transferase [bacterium]|nr:phosphoethanolamine--lipid A transferase [bacterium]